MAAMFLRHEGFLGAMGAFLKVHPMGPTAERASTSGQPRKVGGWVGETGYKPACHVVRSARLKSTQESHMLA